MKSAGKAPGRNQMRILSRETRNGEGSRLDKNFKKSHEGGGGKIGKRKTSDY